MELFLILYCAHVYNRCFWHLKQQNERSLILKYAHFVSYLISITCLPCRHKSINLFWFIEWSQIHHGDQNTIKTRCGQQSFVFQHLIMQIYSVWISYCDLHTITIHVLFKLLSVGSCAQTCKGFICRSG